MSLQYANQSSVTVCCGVSSSGKSTFAIRYLLNADLTTRFIFDPRGEYSERLNLPACETLEELMEASYCGWVCFNPHRMFPGLVIDAFKYFCDFVFSISEKLPGKKVLFVDEVWRYCSPNSIPMELAMIVQDGRKNGIGLLVCGQRPNRINEAILNETSEIVCFRLRGKRALETVCEYGSFDADEIESLPNLHFVSENLDSGAVLRAQLVL